MPRRKADTPEKEILEKEIPGKDKPEKEIPGKDKPEKETPPQGIEEEFVRLEEIIKKLESGDSTLEESFACYEAGMKLVKSLNGKIDQVEKKIQILSEGDENE